MEIVQFYTEMIKIGKNIDFAKDKLDKGGLVAIPTETVYGLAGNAYSLKALKTIYKLKKRPKKNPLIIHYYNLKMAKNDVVLNDNFIKLYKKFCPGPITFVLKKKSLINFFITKIC